LGILDLFRKNLSKDDFAALVMQRARHAAQPVSARYDAEAFQINFELADGRMLIMQLGNAFRDTLAVPRTQRHDIIDKYLASLTDDRRVEDVEEALGRLMPVIRDTAMFGWGALSARLSGNTRAENLPCLRPFAETLSLALVLDSETATSTVSRKSLSDWGVDADDAFARALSNLRDRTSDAGMERHGGMWISTWNDVYDASRALLTDMIHRLPVHGEPVAVIPARNNLFVTGSLDDEGIARMAALAADVLETDTRPLSGQLFILRDGTWAPFDGNVPADTARRLSLTRYQRLIGIYGDQKALLEKIHEKERVDVFVASYEAAQDTDTGQITGSAQWTRGVSTLLPHCDELWLFCDLRNEVLDIAWDDAVRYIPGLAKPVDDLQPPRFLLKDFPDDLTYDALKQRATRVRQIPAYHS
jgi:uncharacterized protein YtpQ (UPF0354 family)